MILDDGHTIRNISDRYSQKLTAMEDFNSIAIKLLNSDKLKGPMPKYVTNAVHMASTILYTRALEQYRSFQLLCKRGLCADASCISRSLLETTFYLVFVLKSRVILKWTFNKSPKPKRAFNNDLRAKLYFAYSLLQFKKTASGISNQKRCKLFKTHG